MKRCDACLNCRTIEFSISIGVAAVVLVALVLPRHRPVSGGSTGLLVTHVDEQTPCDAQVPPT
jgi:hypothetical protein